MSKKLGYFVPEFPAQTHTFLWRELRELRKLGVDPVLFSTRKPPARLCVHATASEEFAATTYLFPPRWGASLGMLFLHPRGFLNALLWCMGMEGWLIARLKALGLLLCAADLMSQCRQRGVEHVHVPICSDTAIVALLCRKLGGPTYSLSLLAPLIEFGGNQRSKWRHASFGVAITQRLFREIHERLHGFLPPTMLVAPVGVDLDRFRRSAPYQPWQPGHGPALIFSCGRLNISKGHDVLIEAIAALRRDGADVRLIIAGEDADPALITRRRLESQREQLGLKDSVTLLGAISEDDVRRHMEQAHVFVLASRAEPLGVVYMEAMALGLPVIGTRGGGVDELVQDGVNGRLVPPGDPGAIAAAIRELLSRPDQIQQFQVEGRNTVERRFSSELGAKALVEGLKTVRPLSEE